MEACLVLQFSKPAGRVQSTEEVRIVFNPQEGSKVLWKPARLYCFLNPQAGSKVLRKRVAFLTRRKDPKYYGSLPGFTVF